MSRPFWTARHVETLSQLPEKLERGRAYFVDDENYIVIDYGRGPVIYGGKPGPSGIPGEPLPQIQGQIDNLADASLMLSNALKNINDMRVRDVKNLASAHAQDMAGLEAKHDEDISRLEAKHDEELQTLDAKHDEDISRLEAKHDEELDSSVKKAERELYLTSEAIQLIINEHDGHLTEMIHNNTDAVLNVMKTMYDKFTQTDKAIYTLFKLLASLYPNADIDTRPYEEADDTALTAGEILSTASGSYKVRNSYKDSETGAYVVIIDTLTEAESMYVNTLNDGDIFTDAEGHVWTVRENILTDGEGVILLSAPDVQTLAETLRAGDTVTVGDKEYTVTAVSSENGTLSLSLSE